MRTELGLDGTGTLVDVGCGPGVLAVQLAPLFEVVIGIDPGPAMLAEPVATAPTTASRPPGSKPEPRTSGRSSLRHSDW
jgi:2-polyprenyl-3-methyl-5-hydroxy-6-metoxy-1,4-benzoquinol methylase